MIKKLEISGVHVSVDPKLHEYVSKKIGKLDRYIPKRARESTHAEVFLKEAKIKTKKECTCEVVMHLPGNKLMTKETTMNMFAAVDIVEAKLKNQLKKYKETHSSLKLHRRILARIRRGER
ncbi:MAG TPA: ribosome-associated translation inhibitor RaiA [Patescibacteria group bacterium]|nr:ribosome-associated translation inhibitor RaiA [Patescibacteria group bacterium]